MKRRWSNSAGLTLADWLEYWAACARGRQTAKEIEHRKRAARLDELRREQAWAPPLSLGRRV